MAKRRMFSMDIVDSDAFLDMPASTQNLYFHLGMRADDDGFLNNPKKVTRLVGASDDDLKLLLAKRFLIAFDSGVMVIKHWKINNYIQKDRYRPTVYQDEFMQLLIKENGAYTECIQDVSKVDAQDRIGKDSIEIELDQSNQDSITNNIYTMGPRESICDRLTDNQWDLLDKTYEDLNGLIDLIDDRLRLSQEKINSPYAYIISVAKSERWATKP